MEAWKEKLPLILKELYEVVFHLGGTISGEHGIGSKRASYLPIVMSPELIALQKRIKQVFDPLNILNPGKIFP
jgi:glycolate oxidase